MNLQMLLFATVGAAFVVSMISDSMLRKASATLSPEVRERIFQMEDKRASWWRTLEIIAIIVIIAGVFRMHRYPYSGIAAGVSLFCIASSLRAWFTSHAYSSQVPGTSESRRARNAALFVSIVELTLAGAVCGYVYTHLVPRGGSGGSAAKNNSSYQSSPEPERAQNSGVKSFWVSEEEASKLLKGKSTEYLRALVKRKDIRSQINNGKHEYRRDDLEAMKEAGLPSEEEVNSSN